MMFEVIRKSDGKETSIVYYNNRKEAEEMCSRLNQYKNIYYVKINLK
jgi:superfamily II DNA helicase RecQ